MGHKAVFLSDPGFRRDLSKVTGSKPIPVALSEPMPPEQMAKFWEDFINGHIPNFRKAPIDQIDNYVKECWEAIVDSAKWAQKDLPGILDKSQAGRDLGRQRHPLPGDQAIRRALGTRSSRARKTRSRTMRIPPHLSGMSENDTDRACHKAFRARFNERDQTDPRRFQRLSCRLNNEDAYPLGQFFEASPHT